MAVSLQDGQFVILVCTLLIFLSYKHAVFVKPNIWSTLHVGR